MDPHGTSQPLVARSAYRDDLVSASRYGTSSEKPRTFPMWLLLAAILLIPAGLNVHLSGEGLKFTPGRAAIALLLMPAISIWLRPSRRIVASDIFAFLTSMWMVGSRIPDDGLNPSAVASVVELLGGYIVGRAYFYGPRALMQFLKIFKVVAFLVIIIAVLDPLFGQNVAQTIVAMIAQGVGVPNQTRLGFVRAASTLEMAELYGTFCCTAASIFLFLETNRTKKFFWVGISFFGCILSLSSGPLLSFTIIILFTVYDRLFRRFSKRWKLVVSIAASFLLIVFFVVDRPFSWLVSHMTLDPETGFFRLFVFDYVAQQISMAPLVGYGFGAIGSDEFLATTTVDNVWLVCAARYGIPMIVFFLFANVSTFATLSSARKKGNNDPFMTEAGTAFTQVLMTFMLVGVTVHFWNAMWQFWAVCIGIRGSIKEWHAHGKHSRQSLDASP